MQNCLFGSFKLISIIPQPVGVGYSYTEKGDKGVWTTEAAAKDVSSGRRDVLPT